MADEHTSLLPQADPKKFYFLTKKKSSTSDKSKEGNTAGEKPAAELTVHPSQAVRQEALAPLGQSQQQTWWSSWFRNSSHPYQIVGEGGLASKPRAVPVKIEPKVFFANERTFLAWLHMSVTLASISVAIVAFAEANEWSQIYGLMLLPVAIAFCIYSLTMYIRRANMIRRKDPGPYEERVGPIALACMLGVAILLNFIVKLYDYAT